MKEIKAEQPILVENVDGGVLIRIPGDPPPTFAMISLGASVLGISMLGLSSPGLFILAIIFIAVGVFAYKFNMKEQTVQIINGKLMARNRSFDMTDISSIKLGNANSSVTLLSNDSVTFASGGLGITAASISSALQTATAAYGNALLISNTKKAYYVQIVYGTKKYYLAKAMREIRAKALYDVLTAN